MILDRAAGVLLGAAAGSALGAGYALAPPLRENTQVTMGGGGKFGWSPGEWTDDLTMALPIAQVLASGGSLSDETSMDRVVAEWSRWEPEARDADAATRKLLRSLPAHTAAAAVEAAALASFHSRRKVGSNGALLRGAFAALSGLDDEWYFFDPKLPQRVRPIVRLTHRDPDVADACVLWSLTVEHAIRTGEIDLYGQLKHLPGDRRNLWWTRIQKAEALQPSDFSTSSAVQTLQAAWSAVHRRGSLVEILERAARSGKEAEAVAATAGALLGAAPGGSAVPARWRRILHGAPGLNSRSLTELAVLAARGGAPDGHGWPLADKLEGTNLQTLVAHPHDDGVLLASLSGLDRLPDDVSTVVSMCRVGRKQTSREHVEFWLVDKPDANVDVDGVLIDAADTIADLRAEGQRVALHCFEARSRTSAVAATYAVRHMGVPLDQALDDLRRALPDYAPQQFLLDAVARIAQDVVVKVDHTPARWAPEPPGKNVESHPPAGRFVAAQSWWIASELARRNDLAVYEMHPGGGMYDVLTLTSRPGWELDERRLEMNRAGRLHLHPQTTGWMTWEEVIGRPDPHTVVRLVEEALGLHPDPHPHNKPTTTRRSLTYRVLARALTITLDDRHRWDVRMGFLDDSSLYPGEQHGFDLERTHKTAVAHAQTLTAAEDDDPFTHLWVLGYDLWSPDRHVAAVISDDARLFRGGEKKPVDLMALYTKHGRRLGPVVSEALGAVLP